MHCLDLSSENRYNVFYDKKQEIANMRGFTKRCSILLLALVFLLSLPGAEAVMVADVPSNWAINDVQTAASLGLVPERLQQQYQQAATRAEFCALIVTVLEAVYGPVDGRVGFTDTNDANVEKAAYLGVVKGVGDGKFAPEQSLTREQAAVMLVALLQAGGTPLPVQMPDFADKGEIAGWAAKQVGQVQKAGIMNGTGNNMFSPKGDYTIEQCIVTVLKAYRILTGEVKVENTAVLQSLPITASLKKGMTDAEFQQAYDIAYELVKDLAGLGHEDQIAEVFNRLAEIRHNNPWEYSMEIKGYNSAYGFFVRHCTSCAGDVRAAGLCLTILGIPYEHVNEDGYTHQWARVPLGDEFVVVDVNGGILVYENEPYKHPYIG